MIRLALSTVIAPLVVSLLAVACSDPKPKSNAEKCQSIGGTYNAATKGCQLQAGD